MAKRALQRDIGIDLLRTFIEVVDTRSYKNAALNLQISQPAVSGHISRLQRQLGAVLFDKSRQGVWLTHAGEAAVESARQILALHDGIQNRIAARETVANAAEMTIGCPDELRCWLLVPALAAFRQEHPDIRFILKRGSSEQLLEQLHKGDLSVCASLALSKPSPTIQSWKQPLHWVGGIDSSFYDSVPLPIVAPPDGPIKTAMLAELHKYEIPYTLTFQAAHMDGAIAAVREQLGISVIFGSKVPAGLTHVTGKGPLRELPSIYWSVYLRRIPEDPGLQQLIDQLAGLLEITIQSIDGTSS